MGQILGQDKIATPSHSSGTITLPPSLLTLGGRQYRTSALSRLISADVTLAANTLYFVYAQLVAGVTALRISTSAPSIYVITNPTAKLVTAFYSNGGAYNLATPIELGSFVNIEGVPKTRQVKYWGEQSGFGPTAEFYNWERLGDRVRITAHITVGGSVSAASTWKIPSNILYSPSTIDGTGFNGGFPDVGRCSYDPQNGNITTGVCLLISNADRRINSYSQSQVAGFGFQWGNTNPNNAVWQLGHQYDAVVEYPVGGWSNTPLKDL